VESEETIMEGVIKSLFYRSKHKNKHKEGKINVVWQTINERRRI
jgi:hypothetical protein